MVLLLAAGTACSTSTSDEPTRSGLDRAKAATVRVMAHGIHGVDGASSFGSGVVVGDGTHVITASHVVAGAQRLEVRADGRRAVSAKLLGTSVCDDLALLQIDEPLTPIAVGEPVSTGDSVYAIGYPQGGSSQAVTAGVISRVGETVTPGLAVIRNALQTDAALNPGNSGGALVTTDGALVGINVAGFEPGYREGVGLAVPVSTVEVLRDELAEGGEGDWHGMHVSQVPLQLEVTGGGLYVEAVDSDSDAARTQIKPGDVVTMVNNRPVASGGGYGRCDAARASESPDLPVIVNRDGDWYAGTIGTDPLRKVAQLPESGATLRDEAYLADAFAFPFLVATDDEWVVDLHLPGATTFHLASSGPRPLYVGFLAYQPRLPADQVVQMISRTNGLVVQAAESVQLGLREALRIEVRTDGGYADLVEVLPGLVWRVEPGYRDVIYVVTVGGGSAVIDIQVPANAFERLLPRAMRFVESTQFLAG